MNMQKMGKPCKENMSMEPNSKSALKPILFNTEMVRSILAGEKTCTRRIAKSGKPPFAAGDILWVRETWCINNFGTHCIWTATIAGIRRSTWEKTLREFFCK